MSHDPEPAGPGNFPAKAAAKAGALIRWIRIAVEQGHEVCLRGFVSPWPPTRLLTDGRHDDRHIHIVVESPIIGPCAEHIRARLVECDLDFPQPVLG